MQYLAYDGGREIVVMILPIVGIVVFPLFTVYLTDYVKRNNNSQS